MKDRKIVIKENPGSHRRWLVSFISDDPDERCPQEETDTENLWDCIKRFLEYLPQDSKKNPPADDCIWRYDEIHDMWESSCGEAHTFPSGSTPAENSYIFCPYCGRAIAQSLDIPRPELRQVPPETVDSDNAGEGPLPPPVDKNGDYHFGELIRKRDIERGDIFASFIRGESTGKPIYDSTLHRACEDAVDTSGNIKEYIKTEENGIYNSTLFTFFIGPDPDKKVELLNKKGEK